MCIKRVPRVVTGFRIVDGKREIRDVPVSAISAVAPGIPSCRGCKFLMLISHSVEERPCARGQAKPGIAVGRGQGGRDGGEAPGKIVPRVTRAAERENS